MPLGPNPAPLAHEQRAAKQIGPDLHPVEAPHVLHVIDARQFRLLGEERKLDDRGASHCLGALGRHESGLYCWAPAIAASRTRMIVWRLVSNCLATADTVAPAWRAARAAAARTGSGDHPAMVLAHARAFRVIANLGGLPAQLDRPCTTFCQSLNHSYIQLALCSDPPPETASRPTLTDVGHGLGFPVYRSGSWRAAALKTRAACSLQRLLFALAQSRRNRNIKRRCAQDEQHRGRCPAPLSVARP